MTHGGLRRGVCAAAGAGHRRGGQRPATVRYRPRGSGPGWPPLAARIPVTPGRFGAALPRSFTLSVLGPRILRKIGPGRTGPARAEGAPLKKTVEKVLTDKGPKGANRVSGSLTGDRSDTPEQAWHRAVARSGRLSGVIKRVDQYEPHVLQIVSSARCSRSCLSTRGSSLTAVPAHGTVLSTHVL
jgi:hypothetical protein